MYMYIHKWRNIIAIEKSRWFHFVHLTHATSFIHGLTFYTTVRSSSRPLTGQHDAMCTLINSSNACCAINLLHVSWTRTEQMTSQACASVRCLLMHVWHSGFITIDWPPSWPDAAGVSEQGKAFSLIGASARADAGTHNTLSVHYFPITVSRRRNNVLIRWIGHKS